MVTLDDLLEEEVEQRTDALLHWHRNTQLIQYADWLHALQRDAGPQLTDEMLLQHIEHLETFWLSLSARLNDEMAILLPLLNSDQQHELFLNIADRNEAFRENYVEINNAERIEIYYERLLDTSENWFGDLTSAQELAIEQAAGELMSSAPQRLERRKQWQAGILGILEQNDSIEARSGQLRNFLAGFEKEDQTLNAITDTNKRIITKLTVQLVHSLNARQKTHFIVKTSDYIQMFIELAEDQ